jgi:quinol monooxygenase YgiN
MKTMNGTWVGRTATSTAAGLAALALLAGPTTALAQEMAAEAPPAADPADVESIDAIMTAVYDVISGEAGEARDWDRFMSLFIPEARLIPSGRNQQGQHGYAVWTPQQYVETVGPQLEENGFFEDEAYRVTEHWGDIAHLFSTYNSYHTAADMEAGKTFQRGINSFQLMYDGERWWVVSIFWEAEAPDRPIPDEYLSDS